MNFTDTSLPQRGPEIIAPASTRMIILSIVLAVLLELLPWPRAALLLVPDFPLLVLLYWNTHEPRRAPMWVALLLGLLADVAHGVLLGLHALAYVAASFGTLMLQRRLANFGALGQALQLVPMFLAARLLVLAVGLALSRGDVAWAYLAGGMVGALLWLPLCLLLNRVTGRPVEPPKPAS